MRNNEERAFIPEAEPRDDSKIIHEAHKHRKQSKEIVGLALGETVGLTSEQFREKRMALKKIEQTEKDEKNLRAAKLELNRVAGQPTIAYGEQGDMPFQERRANASKPAVPAVKTEGPALRLPPISKEATILDVESEITPPPHTFWGKIADRTRQIFDSNLRDIRANQKFATMSADTDETSADKRAAAQGEKMMKRQTVSDVRTRAKEAAMTAKWSRQAEKDTQRQSQTDEEIEQMFAQGYLDKKLSESEDLRNETLAEKLAVKADAMGRQEYKKTMRADKLRSQAEQLEEEAESETRPGPYIERGKANMEKLKQRQVEIYEKLKGLRSMVESIKLGWFAHLKIDNAGYITNLPEGNENIVFEYLTKEKERLGAKGKIDKANEIVEQMEALEEYTNKLAEREKLKAETGQL